jgi:hypothetical protein
LMTMNPSFSRLVESSTSGGVSIGSNLSVSQGQVAAGCGSCAALMTEQALRSVNPAMSRLASAAPDA